MDLEMILTIIAGILVLIGVIYTVFRLFEKSKPKVEYIVLLAILVAISVVGRLVGMSIPGLQLASFIIIMVGIVYGGETGFLVGVLTALVSDLFLGLGYWTFFQMIAWGLMGYTSGLFSEKLDNIYFRVVFGFVWAFIYGFITDFAMFPFMSTINLSSLATLYIAAIPLDLVHGIVNAILLAIVYKWFKNIFERNKLKFLNPVEE